MSSVPVLRALSVCAAALAATALMSGTAFAGDDAPAAGCPFVPTVQPFAPWQDFADYFLVPDGDLEQGAAGWNLDPGATAVEGNEPFQVGGAGDHSSLRLQAGAGAATATFCVGAEHRTMRFFARGSGAGALLVEAVFEKRRGNERRVHLASLTGSEEWAATPVIPMIVNEQAGSYGNAMPVSLRFTARGGSWQIDDVYVDPYRRG